MSALNGPPAKGQAVDNSQQLQDLRTSVVSVQNDLRVMFSKTQASSGVVCPPVQEVSCVSSSYMLIFLFVQLLCIIGYLTYRSTKEAAAKKFY